jgi:hypothetical protein
MTRRTTAPILAFLLTLTMISPVTSLAGSTADKDNRLARSVRTGIEKLGTGEASLVKIKLKNKTEHAGFISEVGDSAFVLKDLNDGEATTIAYGDVAQAKGNNLSTGAKVAIGVGIIAGVIIVLYLVRGAFCDGC